MSVYIPIDSDNVDPNYLKSLFSVEWGSHSVESFPKALWVRLSADPVYYKIIKVPSVILMTKALKRQCQNLWETYISQWIEND